MIEIGPNLQTVLVTLVAAVSAAVSGLITAWLAIQRLKAEIVDLKQVAVATHAAVNSAAEILATKAVKDQTTIIEQAKRIAELEAKHGPA